jgi:ElaB/YqjD/DUF883 family membrane-anchored ribosome-binding protein
MSQNFNNTSNPTGTGGAGTGATDAGTTRDTGGDTTFSGSTGATGSGSTGLTTGGGAGAAGGGAATGTAAAREGMGGAAQEYGQKIADAASTARDYVNDKLSVAKDKFGDLQNVDYRQAADNAKEYARQNPGQALVISAAAGFLLGLLLRGTRR